MINTINNDIPYETVSIFAKQLTTFAASLSDGEKKILVATIMKVLDPLDRMHWKDISGLLSSNEIVILHEIEEKES